jgi:flagellar basal-body rod protein FlgB
MAALAENALHYGAATRVASKKLALLRYVASDGVG